MERTVSNQMVLTVPNLTQNVALCRVAVAAFASQLDFTVSEIEELKVAVSEAVTNSVIHAYESTGDVRLTVYCAGNCITVEVRDWGRGIQDVAQARQASYTTVPGRMGLGFSFLESLAEDLQVTAPPDGGTSVSFRKCAIALSARESDKPSKAAQML